MNSIFYIYYRKWFPNQIRKISQGKISLEKNATGQDGRAAILQKKQSKKEFKVGQFKDNFDWWDIDFVW